MGVWGSVVVKALRY